MEDEIFIDIPYKIERPPGWKSTEQKRREYNEARKEYIREWHKIYYRKNKERIKKVKHQHYIRTMKRVKKDRMLRYANDPEWREQVKAYNRERQRRIREEKLRKLQEEDIKQEQNKTNEQS